VVVAPVLLAAGWLAATGIAEEPPAPRSVRLLVSCDEATRAKVLEALASLDVTVHDLATMQAIASKAPSSGAAPAGVLPARRVMEGVQRVLERLRTGDPTLELRGMDVRGSLATLRLRTASTATLDALDGALGTETALAGTDLRRGAMRPSGGMYETDVTLRFPPSHAALEALEPSDASSLPLETVRDVATAVGGRMMFFGAQQVDISPHGEVVSADVEFSLAPGAVADLVKRLDEMPGIRVTGLSWKVAEKGGDARPRVRLSLRRR
jgi:hypothetical protein